MAQHPLGNCASFEHDSSVWHKRFIQGLPALTIGVASLTEAATAAPERKTT
jgi:hypothetical protein